MTTVIAFLFPATYLLAFAVERVWPARPLPRVPGWVVKGLVFFAIAGVFNAVLPQDFAASALGDRRRFALSGVAGVAVAFVAGDLTQYWVHRAMHLIYPLWRWTHQMHHSAERMDIAGFSYAHPLDDLVSFGLAAIVGVAIGVTPEAASVAGFALFALQIVSHTNVHTPRWLGYFIQRPEMHSLHHGRGVHAYNYGTTALWDHVFGTFRNPAEFVEETGFWDGASSRLGAMLIGRDVSERG